MQCVSLRLSSKAETCIVTKSIIIHAGQPANRRAGPGVPKMFPKWEKWATLPVSARHNISTPLSELLRLFSLLKALAGGIVGWASRLFCVLRHFAHRVHPECHLAQTKTKTNDNVSQLVRAGGKIHVSALLDSRRLTHCNFGLATLGLVEVSSLLPTRQLRHVYTTIGQSP